VILIVTSGSPAGRLGPGALSVGLKV
jgi:hypothetical protein